MKHQAKCCICKRKEQMVRDHSHKTGYIRGLLCKDCNYWLGIYENGKKFIGDWDYDTWVARFDKVIVSYLATTTDLTYSQHNYKDQFEVLLERRRNSLLRFMR